MGVVVGPCFGVSSLVSGVVFVLGQVHDLLTHPDSGLLFSRGLPHGDIVGFEDVTSRIGVEAFAQLSVLMKLL